MVSSSRSNELNGDNDDIKSKLMTNFEEFPYVFYRLLITIAKSPWIGWSKNKKEKNKGKGKSEGGKGRGDQKGFFGEGVEGIRRGEGGKGRMWGTVGLI